jgi:hypothetical protein
LERELLSVRNPRRSKDLFNSFTRRITVMLTVAENQARQIRVAAKSAPRGSPRPNALQMRPDVRTTEAAAGTISPPQRVLMMRIGIRRAEGKHSLTCLKHSFIVPAYPSAGSPNNRQGRLAFRVLQQGDLP